MWTFERPALTILRARLKEPPTDVLVLAGPRRVGKTYAALTEGVCDRVVAADGNGDDDHDDDGRAAADMASARDHRWLTRVWKQARVAAAGHADKHGSNRQPYVLAIDEIHKIKHWSSTIKGLRDEDEAGTGRAPFHVVLLGSSPALMLRGLRESLVGRFEVISMPHWSYGEMEAAFDVSLDEFVFFGGYPNLRWQEDEQRWRDRVLSSIIEPSIGKDLFDLANIQKPVLLRQLFQVACRQSSKILAYNKLLGDLDGGNTTTLTGYMQIFADAQLVRSLYQFTDGDLRKRASRPKFSVFNNALMSAQGGYTFAEARADRTHWGALVESAVGAHLLATAGPGAEVSYWRVADDEVDFVVSTGRRLWAIEVKAGRSRSRSGLRAFQRAYPRADLIEVSGDGDAHSLGDDVRRLRLDEALRHPFTAWSERWT